MGTIILVGFMGSGKSTLGKELARELGYTLIETDEWIEGREGMSVLSIFAEKGEPYFREKEKEMVEYLALVDNAVVATGGGLPCYSNNMERLKNLGTTIWLDIPIDILAKRLRHEKDNRPLIKDIGPEEDTFKKYLQDLLNKRIPFYSQARYTSKTGSLDDLLPLLKEEAN